MKRYWPVLQGLAIALVSIGLLFGGLSLSLAEGISTIVPGETPTETPGETVNLPPTNTPDLTLTTLQIVSPTLAGSLSPSPTPNEITPTLPPPPTNCPPPAGWLPYIVKPGDTLASLAGEYQVSNGELSQANCLLTTELPAGAIVYVPPVPTKTPIPCGPPHTWVTYTVQHGDTLYHLSQAYGITVADLQAANCMGQSTLLHTGQKLYVPPGATRTPSPTLTGIPTITPTVTILPSNTPAASATGTPTPSASLTPSDTPTGTATDTQTPSPSPTDTTP
jgi:LysM repeat protein